MTTNVATVIGLLGAGDDDATALFAPGGVPLSYRQLRAVVNETVAALNAHGIGRNDRVALVLDNGPLAASAFLAVAGGATAAPLNPGYRAEEFEFYLTDLRAGLLIVEAGKVSPAIDVAAKLGIPIARLVAAPDRGAGAFTLELPPSSAAAARQPGAAEPDDIALVLHTSGTTSRPKIVPLSQLNICTSARNVRTTLGLTALDRALNIMPLFHIHGLIAGVMAPLSVAGAVSCTPGFNALKFFGWMSEARPTWYTAVPTMHQAILMRARNYLEIIRAHPLRFIRSSSSSLPPQVLHELEEVFGAPVAEAYGMTEAAHQMACNPLPPGVRKPGTVGIAAGPEVCILDDHGVPAAPEVTGEIAIRGPNVMAGYENNPVANAEAFTNGWFRTGDQGVMDAAGYISITGRLKEIINRGGEKISPREVDEVLLDHPAVQQCVTFALPHDKLGEEVAVVVVLREGIAATADELRDFAARRLADFKVPKKVIFRPEIPKGATGKLQRIGLAQKLGLA
ncbi:MAG TPA: acyl--CoA ligase [Kofleriaceae bacterium]|jgi:acyl-CoA synthetase (AMP-forming)/AMP-acid ligase II|nr:acyl--CoA ligase [Kofleriaceae bacterium]